MPFVNGGFEEPGSRDGEAHRWRLRSFVHSSALAEFGSPPRGHEAFEWLALQRRLTATDAVRAVFGAAPAEAFSSWAIGAALSFGDIAAQSALFDTLRVERFAQGWGVVVFVRDWSAVISVRAEFGGPAETFHAGWPGTALRFEQWADVVSVATGFDGEFFERFGASWPLIS